MTAFVKERATAPPGFFRCEALGLRWLAASGGPRVVKVLGVARDRIELERLTPAPPTTEDARTLGLGLARMHAAGADAFGSPPPGWEGDGFFGPLNEPYPLVAGTYARWSELYAHARVAQVRRLLTDRADTPLLTGLDRVAARLLDGRWDDELPPARLHGDLWSGNVMWTTHGATLIDPAAHGGHPVTDLAMLDLFGLPFLRHVLAAYEETATLPDGWRDLIGLHQIYPVGMHAVLFGSSYMRQLGQLVADYS